MAWIRTAALYSLRSIGLFALAQHLTRRRLRILCYHGFSLGNEHETAPYVFMRISTFERRMRILRKRRIPVIALHDAIGRLANNEINNAETVITLDDGWSTNLLVVPILQSFDYPACIYITTEHLSAGTEAFNVIVGQMLMNARVPNVQLGGIHPLLDGFYEIKADPTAAAALIVERSAGIASLQEKQALLRPLAAAIGLDYAEFVRGGRFRFMTREELKSLPLPRISIELHTHTHQLPAESFQVMQQEITQNQRLVEAITGQAANHFCYPSGKYSQQHPAWLSQLGILSATTCDAGFNDRRTSPYLLRRYLDSDNVSDIEFEAEIAGVRELLRNGRSRLKRLLP